MAFSVLFVCTGNVCRSPAAERLLLRSLQPADGVVATSAGTSALVGEPMSPPMAALVAEQGASPDGFAARQLEPAHLLEADLVVAMTSAHRTTAVTMAPASVQYAYTLAQLGAMLSLVDPRDLDAAAPAADSGARLAAAVALGRNHRALGVDPADDIVDPYGRSGSVYGMSFKQIMDGLAPVARAVSTSR